jgi:hypothetical protein
MLQYEDATVVVVVAIARIPTTTAMISGMMITMTFADKIGDKMTGDKMIALVSSTTISKEDVVVHQLEEAAVVVEVAAAPHHGSI